MRSISSSGGLARLSLIPQEEAFHSQRPWQLRTKGAILPGAFKRSAMKAGKTQRSCPSMRLRRWFSATEAPLFNVPMRGTGALNRC